MLPFVRAGLSCRQLLQFAVPTTVLPCVCGVAVRAYSFVVWAVAVVLFCRAHGFVMGEVRRACSFAVPTTV